MGSVYLVAMLLGRPRSVLPALGLAAAVMVAVSPEVVWSVSFQLSFAAMGGIALLAEPMDEWMRRMSADRLDRSKLLAPALRALSSTTAMTVAATVATLPLIAFYFQRVSLVGLPTTALVLPAVPGVLVTQAAAGAVGMIDTTIAKPLGLARVAAHRVRHTGGPRHGASARRLCRDRQGRPRPRLCVLRRPGGGVRRRRTPPTAGALDARSQGPGAAPAPRSR